MNKVKCCGSCEATLRRGELVVGGGACALERGTACDYEITILLPCEHCLTKIPALASLMSVKVISQSA